MKTLISSILTLVFCFISYAQSFDTHNAIELNSEKEYSEKMRINKVKKRTKYLYKFDTIKNSSPKKTLLGYTFYNEAGKQIKDIKTTDLVTIKTIFKYNKRGELLNKKKNYEYTPLSDKRHEEFRKKFFNDNKAKIYSRQISFIKTQYKYDKNGYTSSVKSKALSVVKETKEMQTANSFKIFDYKPQNEVKNNKLDWGENFRLMSSTFLKGNNGIEQSYYDSINKKYLVKIDGPRKYSIVIYDLNNQFKVFRKEEIVIKKYANIENSIGKVLFKFNSENFVNRLIDKDNNEVSELEKFIGKHIISLYEYNNKNELIKISYSNLRSNDKVKYKTVFRYNNKGLLVEEIAYDKNNTKKNRYRYGYSFYE